MWLKVLRKGSWAEGEEGDFLLEEGIQWEAAVRWGQGAGLEDSVRAQLSRAGRSEGMRER